jgi:Uma2 family endonuclease
MSTAMHEWPRRHRITVDHFYRMGEAGLFGADERVELVNGEIIDVPPMGSRHAGILDWIARAIGSAVSTRAFVRQQLPLGLNDDSEPLPDLAIVRPRPDNYIGSHPTAVDVQLVVEVSESTLRYDRDVKTELYARCGVPEVWVVDLRASRVHVYQSPRAGKYADVRKVEIGRLPIGALPGLVVDLTLPMES